LTLATTIHATTSVSGLTARERAGEVPMMIVIGTTGGNLKAHRAISAGVRVTIRDSRTWMHTATILGKMRGGPSGTAIRAMHSRAA